MRQRWIDDNLGLIVQALRRVFVRRMEIGKTRRRLRVWRWRERWNRPSGISFCLIWIEWCGGRSYAAAVDRTNYPHGGKGQRPRGWNGCYRFTLCSSGI